jgi:hypothetical protein
MCLLIAAILAHPAMFTIGAYWLFSAVVGGMPQPTASSGAGYTWLHNSLHILAGNLSSAMAARYPTILVPPGTAVQQQETQTTTVVRPQ